MTQTRDEHKEELQGKVALVTGAAGGLGAALATALATRGATVIACDVDLEALDRLVPQAGRRVHPQLMDLRDPDQIQRCFSDVTRDYGEIDIVAHTAIRHFGGDDI